MIPLHIGDTVYFITNSEAFYIGAAIVVAAAALFILIDITSNK